MSNPMAQSDPVEQRFAPSPVDKTHEPDMIEAGSLAGVDVVEALRDVIDPELGINIVDLGLVYGVRIDAEDNVTLDMTLTSAACPLTDVIERQAAQMLGGLAASTTVNWVWMPAWGPDRITPDGRDQLRAIGFNV